MDQKTLKGSMTVEMDIIFPEIFFTILGILSKCLTHYQNIVTGAAAMEAAARGAAYWDKIGGSLAWDFQASNAGSAGGKPASPSFTEHDPYRYIFDGNKGQRLTNIQAFARWRLDQNPNVTLGEETTGEPKVDKGGFGGEGWGLLQKYVTVTVKKKYTNPVDSLLESVGIKLPSEREITASAPLNTPTEFIRNMSLISDWINGPGHKK